MYSTIMTEIISDLADITEDDFAASFGYPWSETPLPKLCMHELLREAPTVVEACKRPPLLYARDEVVPCFTAHNASVAFIDSMGSLANHGSVESRRLRDNLGIDVEAISNASYRARGTQPGDPDRAQLYADFNQQVFDAISRLDEEYLHRVFAKMSDTGYMKNLLLSFGYRLRESFDPHIPFCDHGEDHRGIEKAHRTPILKHSIQESPGNKAKLLS